jgi:hypothetical protein
VVEKGTTCFNSKWFISKLALYTWRDEIQGQNKNAIEEEKGVGQGEEIRGWTHWEVLRDVGHCPCQYQRYQILVKKEPQDTLLVSIKNISKLNNRLIELGLHGQ